MTVKPYGNYVLLEEIEEKTSKGILLIKNNERFKKAKVIDAGKGIDERFHDVLEQFKPGIEVLYDSGGVMLHYEDQMLVSIENIYAIIDYL